MIIGVLGPAGSGKDTVADFLAKKYGFTKIALADPLKRICKEVYSFTDEQLWGPSEFRNQPDLRYPTGRGHLSPRVALQTLGTEWGREMYNNTWIDYGIRVAEGVLLSGDRYSQKRGLYTPGFFERLFSRKPTGVVFSDIRFKNEVDAIRKRNFGFMVRVKRQGLAAVGVAGHASEEEQKMLKDTDFDYVIDNNSTLDDLYKSVVRMLAILPGGGRLRIIK